MPKFSIFTTVKLSKKAPTHLKKFLGERVGLVVDYGRLGSDSFRYEVSFQSHAPSLRTASLVIEEKYLVAR